jgi:ribosome-associated heat shock protein Hsp15
VRLRGARPGMNPEAPSIRLDKWLWQARFCRSRSLAAALVAEGRVRVNSEPVAKPARSIGPGDVLTFALGARIRVVRVVATGARRGPAAEAQALYEDLAPARPALHGGGDAASAPLE